MGTVINAINNRLAVQGEFSKIASAKRVILTKRASARKCAAIATEIKGYLTKTGFSLAEIMPYLKEHPGLHQASNAALTGLGGAGLGAGEEYLRGGDPTTGALVGAGLGAGGQFGLSKLAPHAYVAGQSMAEAPELASGAGRIAQLLRSAKQMVGRGIASGAEAVEGFDPSALAVRGAQGAGTQAQRGYEAAAPRVQAAGRRVGEAAGGTYKKVKGWVKGEGKAEGGAAKAEDAAEKAEKKPE